MKRARLKIVALLCLFALLLAALYPAYQVFQRWSLRRDARLAKEALSQGDLNEARRLALGILREDQSDQAMLKILHSVMVAQNNPAAAEIAQALSRDPSSTAESRLAGFREVCGDLPMASVLRGWFTLPDADRKLADFVNVFATRLIEQGMPSDATKLLEQHPETSKNPDLQVLFAQCLLAEGGLDAVNSAQQTIASLMGDEGPAALQAFRLLALVPRDQFRSGYFTELEPWLKRQPEATPADQLIALNQRLQRFPAQQSEIVANAIKDIGARDPIACARWLQRLGMPREALDLGASANPSDWTPLKADLLADLGLWGELEDWLATDPSGLTAVQLATRKAIAAEKRGDQARSRGMWETIVREAGVIKSSNALLEVVQMTRSAGMEEMSREAMLEAVKLRRGRLPLWSSLRDLPPWLRQQDRGDDLESLYRNMAEIDFTDPEPRLESLDFGILLRTTDPADANSQLELLAKTYEKISENSRFHEIRATARLEESKAREALDALDDFRQINRLPSPRRSTLTALAKASLAASPPTADSLREKIPWNSMIREEREFFTALLEKLPLD